MNTKTEDRIVGEREQLARAVDGLRASEGWRVWVRARARFHAYSLNNTLLIAAQAPTATRVCGFRTWTTLGRQVRRGERAIRIYAPIRLKADDRDPDAKPRVAFRSVAVFDIAQTDPIPGVVQAPLEPPAQPVTGDTHTHLIPRLEGMATGLGYRVEYTTALPPGVDGSCSTSGRVIQVRGSLPANGRVSVLVHEIGHAWGVTGRAYPRAVAEVIVEAATHIVLVVAGLDVSGQSVPYITGWADADDPQEEITRVAGTIDELCRWFDHHLTDDGPQRRAAA